MKELRTYVLNFGGLTNKEHRFRHHVDGDFFKHFDQSPIGACDVEVDVVLTKKPSFMKFDFLVDGTIETQCDRCLEPYDQAVFGDYPLVVKFGDEQDDVSEDDVIHIPRGQMRLDLAPFLYDYIVLSVPMRTVHPDDANGQPGCDNDVIERLQDGSVEDHIDPRWEALKDLNPKTDDHGTSETEDQ